jgi:hypothetical protein
MDHLGWKEGPVWEKGYQYFDRAWGDVLERFRTRFPRTSSRPKRE